MFLRIIFGCICLVLLSCQPGFDREAELSQAREVVEKFYRLYESRDPELLNSLLADDDDMVSFGTDAVEYWAGAASLKEALQRQWASFEEPEVTIRDLRVKLAKSGAVAWFSLFIDLKVNFQGRVTEWLGARSTGVLEKRAGSWVIVQIHNSLPQLVQAAEY